MSNEKNPPNQRIFLALWPDGQVVKKIQQQAIKHFSNCCGRALDKENWHITLAYFGNANTATRLCLEQQVEKIATQPFELELSQLGFWKSPKVTWLAPRTVPKELKQLAFDVQQIITPCGYVPESRAYQPHVTLVKKTSQPPPIDEIEPIHWHVDSFSLAESKTTAEGVVYKVIKSWDF